MRVITKDTFVMFFLIDRSADQLNLTVSRNTFCHIVTEYTHINGPDIEYNLYE